LKPQAPAAPVKKGNREGAALSEDSGRINPPAIRPADTVARAIRTDSVTVKIYNERGENIRNLKWKADTGFNRRWWGMEEKGYRNPGAPKPRPGAPEPSGMQVFPGKYKVVISLGRDADSTIVIIKDDPRLNKTEAAIVAQRQMLTRLRNSTDKLTAAIDRLTEWEEVLGKEQGRLRGLEGKEADSLRKAATRVQDSIKVLREAISGKTTERQGLSRPQEVTVLNTIQQAQQYITAKSVAPGAQEEALVKNAELMINQTVQRVNTFTETTWKDYRRMAEGTKVSLFKEYPPIQ
jgi:hypothetical protein